MRALIVDDEPVARKVLREELEARSLSANALSRALRVNSGRIVEILNGKRAISADTALRLGRFFGNDAEFWMSLQAQYDVALARRTLGKKLEREVLEVATLEQRRIGQELHDSLCQHLTAVAFMSRSMAERLRKHRVIDVEDIEKVAELINDGVTEARTIARGLHPVEMDPNGLADALQSLMQRRSHLPYRLDMDEDLPIPDPDVALHLYRIASEAVINANKHACARELVLRMRSSPQQIELSVTDDGVGLGKNSGDGAGMGFHIMDYRARSIGARLEITPVKPHGTRVACYLPRQ